MLKKVIEFQFQIFSLFLGESLVVVEFVDLGIHEWENDWMGDDFYKLFLFQNFVNCLCLREFVTREILDTKAKFPLLSEHKVSLSIYDHKFSGSKTENC